MPNRYMIKCLTLSVMCGFVATVLLSLTTGYAEEKQRVAVESSRIQEQIGYFNYGGKSYITLGESKDSILTGYQSYKDLVFRDGQVRTVLMQKGVGEKDDWVGKYRGGIYKLVSGKAVLIANIENRNVFVGGKERTLLMKKELNSNKWEITLNDHKVYFENAKRELVHCGYEEIRKVDFNGDTLYLTMAKTLKSDAVWECEHNQAILCSK